MPENYVSSIINNYDDPKNFKKDYKVLEEIYERQGVRIFYDVLRNTIGETALTLNSTSEERLTLMNRMLNELKELTLEVI